MNNHISLNLQYPNLYGYSNFGPQNSNRNFYADYKTLVMQMQGYQESNYNDNTAAKTIGSAALLQGIALLLNKASQWCAVKLQKGKEFTNFENIKKVADRMVKDNKLNVDVQFLDRSNLASTASRYGADMAKELEVVANGQNAFFTDAYQLAVAPKSKPSLILHELGHAINATKGRFIKFLQNSRRYAMFAPTALLILAAAMPNKDGEPNFVQRNAGKLGFLAFAPTIIEEGLASVRGINAAKNVLGKTANLAPLKRNYLFALCTYIIAGLGLGAAAKETMLRESL